ncbi:hypothetical protein D3C81_1486620 [compost metagenome]
MQVQPLQPGRTLCPHGTEFQFLHEGPVQHHAGNNCHQQQYPHEAEEEHARQAGKQIHMQRKHDVHETAAQRRLAEDFAGARIDRDLLHIDFRSRCGRQRDEPDAIIIRFLRSKHADLVRMLSLRNFHHAVHADAWRVRRHLRRFNLGTEQMPDLVMENQRQACHA